MTERGIGRILSIILTSLARDEIGILAASIAYTAVLSVFPLLFGVVALLGLYAGRDPVQQAVVEALRPYLPPDALAAVRDTLGAVVRTRGAVGTLAALGLLWTGTAVAGSLRHGLNRVLHVSRPRAFWRRKLVELAMVLLGGGFITASLLVSGLLAAAETVRPLGALTELVRTSRAFAVLSATGPWVLSALAFFVVYRFLPNARLSRRGLLAGTVTAVVLFEATKRGFFWFLRRVATYPLVYGPLAGVVIFMIWVYLVALLVLIGAEVIRLVEQLREVRGDAG